MSAHGSCKIVREGEGWPGEKKRRGASHRVAGSASWSSRMEGGKVLETLETKSTTTKIIVVIMLSLWLYF